MYYLVWTVACLMLNVMAKVDVYLRVVYDEQCISISIVDLQIIKGY